MALFLGPPKNYGEDLFWAPKKLRGGPFGGAVWWLSRGSCGGLPQGDPRAQRLLGAPINTVCPSRLLWIPWEFIDSLKESPMAARNSSGFLWNWWVPGELSNLSTIITWKSFRCNILDSQLVDSPQDLVVQADPLLCHAESVLPAMSKIFWALGMSTKLSNSQFLGCATFSSAIIDAFLAACEPQEAS